MKIITPPAEEDLPAYLDLFSDKVEALECDKPIASGKAAFADYLRPRLGLHHRILFISYGNPVMVAETLGDISYRGPNVIQDCCFWARVALYHLDGTGKVDQVRFIENGAFWGPPDRPE